MIEQYGLNKVGKYGLHNPDFECYLSIRGFRRLALCQWVTDLFCLKGEGLCNTFWHDHARRLKNDHCFISEFQAPCDFVLIDSKKVKSSLGLGCNKQSNECLFASPAAIREGVYNAHKQLCFDWGRDSIGDTQRGLGVDDMA